MAISNIIVGKTAPDFTLQDENDQPVNLYTLLLTSPMLLVFYPGDFHRSCTKQLCNYRDNLQSFKEFKIQILGISNNSKESHTLFTNAYEFPFPLLSDPKSEVVKKYECTSLWMFGGLSRALFVIGTNRKILYRYIEPTVYTRRSAPQLISILTGLRERGLL